jgi:hypothetical protein
MVGWILEMIKRRINMENRIIKKQGFKFIIIKSDNHTIAIMKGKGVSHLKIKGMAKCNKELDNFDEDYGTQLAIRRAFDKYFRYTIAKAKKLIKRLEEEVIQFEALKNNNSGLIGLQLQTHDFEKEKNNG